MPDPSHPLAFTVDGRAVEVDDDGASLLEVLRDRLGCRGPKDGCSPQGQCGCCTVLVDGAPRVACVTPARRVAGREVTTIDGLPDAGAVGGRVRGDRRQPVRVLHPRHHRAPGRAAGRRRRARRPRTGRARAPRPPVPLHRVAHHPRRLAASSAVLCRHARGSRGRVDEERWWWCCGAGAARGGRCAAGRTRCRARPRRVRGRHRASRRARRRARRARWLVGRRDPHRGPAAGRQGAGPTDDGRGSPAPRPASRRLGPHPAHQLGRACLPRDRRVVVRAGRRTGVAAGERRCVRGQADLGRDPRGPRAGRRPRPSRAGAALTGGHRSPRPETATNRGGRSGRWDGRRAGRPHLRHRRRDPVVRPGAGGGGSRRCRPPDLRRAAAPPAGPKPPCCAPTRRSSPPTVRARRPR